MIACSLSAPNPPSLHGLQLLFIKKKICERKRGKVFFFNFYILVRRAYDNKQTNLASKTTFECQTEGGKGETPQRHKKRIERRKKKRRKGARGMGKGKGTIGVIIKQITCQRERWTTSPNPHTTHLRWWRRWIECTTCG